MVPVEDVTVRPREGYKHERVREYVRSLVSDADPGTPAPSERQLVRRFGVARMTVRQALDHLVSEGLLERVPGRGTFVSRPQVRGGRPLSYSEEMGARNLHADSRTLLARAERAGPGVARALGIAEGGPVVHWRRLRHADGAPMAVEDAFLNEAVLPGILQPSMPVSLYDALAERGLRPTWAEDSVQADLASAEETRLLELPAGSPVLRVSRRALSGDVAVEVSRSAYRADRFSFWVQLGERG